MWCGIQAGGRIQIIFNDFILILRPFSSPKSLKNGSKTSSKMNIKKIKKKLLKKAQKRKPDRTRTGSVALSTEFVGERLVENVEALCWSLLRCATLRCAVLFCFVLFCSMLLRSVLFWICDVCKNSPRYVAQIIPAIFIHFPLMFHWFSLILCKFATFAKIVPAMLQK